MGDTPQTVDWQNDPDFHALPLAEKHKVLLQVDPDYKGLPAKEQAKALDAIHYGSLGQISGTGSLTEGAGTAFVDTLKGMLPPTPQGQVLSKQFWLGDNTVKIHPAQGGIAQAGKEAVNEYGRARQAGAGPLGAGISSGVVGAGSLLGVSDEAQQKLAAQGESGQIVGQSAAPIAAAAVAPLIGKALGGLPGRGTPSPVTGGISPEAAGAIGRSIGHFTRVPGGGWIGEQIGKRFGMEAPPAPAVPKPIGATFPSAEEFKDIQSRHAEFAKNVGNIEKARLKEITDQAKLRDIEQRQQRIEDLKAKRQQDAFAARLKEVEQARQKEITDWAKLDNVSQEDHQAFADRMSEIENERQSALADMERLNEQHAQSLMKRGAQQQTMDAANAQRLADIEKARQGDLAAQERLKEQHAASLNARKAAKPAAAPPPPSPFAGMTSTATPVGNAALPEVPQGSPTLFPQVQRPGGMTPPPAPGPATVRIATGVGSEGVGAAPKPSVVDQPTIGSQIAAKTKAGKSSILSRGTTLVDLTQAPDPTNPLHNEIIQDYQTRSGSQLRTMKTAGDKFADFVLRHFPRP